MIRGKAVKYFLLPLLIFMLEVIFHLFIFGFTLDKTILYYLLSSISLGCLLSCLPGKVSRLPTVCCRSSDRRITSLNKQKAARV